MIGMYEKLTAEQVTAFYQLVNFLRRLRVIGTLYAKTVPASQETVILDNYDLIDMTMAIYGIRKLGYDTSRGIIDAEERLEKIFGTRSSKKFISMRGTP